MKKYISSSADSNVSMESILDKLASLRMDINKFETQNWGSNTSDILHSAARELDKISAELSGATDYVASSEELEYESPLELAQMYFETGHGPTEYDEEYFENEEAFDEYMEYINLGPYGFYEEFKDELDFDSFFVEEYGSNDDSGAIDDADRIDEIAREVGTENTDYDEDEHRWYYNLSDLMAQSREDLVEKYGLVEDTENGNNGWYYQD